MFQLSNRPAAARGFTLVEILVGLVLGLLAIVIMYQVLATFEGQRRTTVGGTDAQSAGHLSLHQIERDMRLAGLGLNYISPGDIFSGGYVSFPTCPGGIRTYNATAGGLGWADNNRPAVPVRITNGTGGSVPPGSDTVASYYLPAALSATPGIVMGTGVSAATLGTLGIQVRNAPWINPTAVPPVNAVFQKDQVILVGQPQKKATDPMLHCVRLKISAITRADPGNPTSDAILWTQPGTNYELNPPVSDYAAFLPPAGYASNLAIVMPSGGSLATQAYAVNGSNQLTVNGTPIAEGVISLQAQYGVSLANSAGGGPCSDVGVGASGATDPTCQTVAGWTDAVANGYGGVDWSALSDMTPANALTTQANIRRIKAVRIAIVARSANLERDSLYVGASAAIPAKASCTASGDIVNVGGTRICAWRDPAGGTAVPLVDPSLTPDEAACAAAMGTTCWDRYRYKVYETIIPLRNVLWTTKTT
jgi:type IV pilus assembly protein PilW